MLLLAVIILFALYVVLFVWRRWGVRFAVLAGMLFAMASAADFATGEEAEAEVFAIGALLFIGWGLIAVFISELTRSNVEQDPPDPADGHGISATSREGRASPSAVNRRRDR